MAKGGYSPLLRTGVLVAALLAMTVAGCGRRGGLERPGTVDPAVAGDVANPAPAVERPAKPQRDFILDAII
ncbi:LPS translocon maturation chaperone LptM [Stappia sp. ICDLI1TA098]|jgi:predicted small lipoprotein YifL